ncbi:MAG TPA: hypothetical protein VHP11_13960, partial [Tepidisphaeraceae bacterium]|nr:hypothetical protein [Tepidisphaeraceae bacterium]
VEFFEKLLPQVKNEAVRRAIQLQLTELYKAAGQQDKAMEQLESLIISAPAMPSMPGMPGMPSMMPMHEMMRGMMMPPHAPAAPTPSHQSGEAPTPTPNPASTPTPHQQ